MKIILVLLSLPLILFSACGQIRAESLTSAESIFKYLQNKHSGLSENDVCIDECELLNDLFIVGYFAHDRGCGNPIYFFKGQEILLNKKTIKSILMNSGFKEDKLKTVESYHKEVTNQYQRVLIESPEEFETVKYKFTPPTTKIQNGMITSTMWVQEPSGMMPEVSFHFSTVQFKLDGSFVSHKKTEHFSVDL